MDPPLLIVVVLIDSFRILFVSLFSFVFLFICLCFCLFVFLSLIFLFVSFYLFLYLKSSLDNLVSMYSYESRASITITIAGNDNVTL